jgi:hypothetical protein
MSPNRNGLPCLLVLALLLAAAAWTPASANDRWSPSVFTEPPPSLGETPFGPTSGEPDVGGTPAPPRANTNGSTVSIVPVSAGATTPWSQLPPWVRLVMRTWTVWFPGLS